MTTATLESPVLDLSQRDIRQRSFVPPDELACYTALVIGTGAVGRQVGLMLAGLGIPRMALIDFDKIEVVNLNPQGWSPADIDRYKVEVLAESIRAYNPDVKLFAQVSRFGRAFWSEESFLELHPPDAKLAVFACVDQMAARQFIWQQAKERAAFFVDARMGGETIRILTSRAPATDDYYETTLFADSEAHQTTCTAQGSNYVAAFAAAHLVTQFTKSLRNFMSDRDYTHNVLANELFVDD